MPKHIVYKVFTDGGARGNPGPAAIGVLIKTENGKIAAQISKTIGVKTNNEAEYQALLSGLEYFSKNKVKLLISSQTVIDFYCDSKLIVNQVNGLFKVKDSRMREYIYKVREIETQIPGKIHYHLIPREKNYEADALVNLALDKML